MESLERLRRLVRAHGDQVELCDAGVYSFAPLQDIDTKQYHGIFDANVLGLLLATGAAASLFPRPAGPKFDAHASSRFPCLLVCRRTCLGNPGTGFGPG
jgi:hypothetical protein